MPPSRSPGVPGAPLSGPSTGPNQNILQYLPMLRTQKKAAGIPSPTIERGTPAASWTRQPPLKRSNQRHPNRRIEQISVVPVGHIHHGAFEDE